jgi:hypothetical protein
MPEARPAADVHAADWIVQGVRDFGCGVGSLVPAVFDRYARVFHPASRDSLIGDESVEVRWAEVADANDRIMHPAAEWGSLTGSWQLQSQDCVWDHKPLCGQLPRKLGNRLATILAPHAGEAGPCYFGVWDGWGEPSLAFMFRQGTPENLRRDLEERARERAERRIAAWFGLLEQAHKFSLPGRRMHLLEGPLDVLAWFYDRYREPPSIWWPRTRAWCIATDIDLMSTYVGGSAETVQALLDDEQIEALAVSVDQSVDWETDTLNPLPMSP